MLNVDKLYLFELIELVGSVNIVLLTRLAYLENYFVRIGEMTYFSKIHRDNL
jgi:hypothetical protein